jgi:hypothetical protein
MALSESQDKRNAQIQTAKIITENHNKAADLAMKRIDHEHSHAKDVVDTIHKLTQTGKDNEKTI